jgi:hypothetical protein
MIPPSGLHPTAVRLAGWRREPPPVVVDDVSRDFPQMHPPITTILPRHFVLTPIPVSAAII